MGGRAFLRQRSHFSISRQNLNGAGIKATANDRLGPAAILGFIFNPSMSIKRTIPRMSTRINGRADGLDVKRTAGPA